MDPCPQYFPVNSKKQKHKQLKLNHNVLRMTKEINVRALESNSVSSKWPLLLQKTHLIRPTGVEIIHFKYFFYSFNC